MIITDEKPDQFNTSLRRIADKINAKRRAELIAIQDGYAGFLQEMHDIRESEVFKHGTRDKSARLIARIPASYWKYLEDLYESRTGSRKFHQDVKFLRAECPEFLTIHTKDL